jgi:uncharacterized protein (TIGR03435 family)
LLAAVGVAAVAGPIAVGVLGAPESQAQPQTETANPVAFEVASIKPAQPDATDRSLSSSPGARLTTANATVKMLVYLAYQVMPFQVSGGPTWLGSDGFDIKAKAADPHASKEQFRQMVQKLLADRFQLKVHTEARELPIYELVTGKRGPKLHEAKDDDPEARMNNSHGLMTGVRATMPMLASALSRSLQRQVVDETGLKGAYSFSLRFLPDRDVAGPRDGGAAPGGDDAGIFTALEEQLGLSLKAGKGPVQVLVIDRAEKPSPN